MRTRLFHLSPGELRNYAHDGRHVLGAWIRDLHSRLCEATRPEQMAEAVDQVSLRKSANALPKSPMQRGGGIVTALQGNEQPGLVGELARLERQLMEAAFHQ